MLPRGTYTPLITPFTRDGAVDYAALDRHLARQLDCGVEGLVVLGTSGEGPTATSEEFADILKRVVARTGEEVVVLAGVGTNDTRSTLRQAQAAAALGCDGLLVVCPYYSRPSQAGLRSHFEALADAVQLPQILYNVQQRTAVNLEPNTLAALSGHPNIVGVKEASGDIDQAAEVIRNTPSDFLVLCGADPSNYPLLSLGGDGVISALANLVPAPIKALVDSALAGDFQRARALHYELLPLARGCFLETNPVPVKTALAWMGEIVESFRAPMCAMQPQNRERWRSILVDHKLLAPQPAPPAPDSRAAR